MQTIKTILNKIAEFFIGISNEYQRRKVLKKQLANMTDPTFLDRALAGEESSEQ